MPANDLSAQYLPTFFEGGEVPDGISFRSALQQVNLDYSKDSLSRIDNLLDQIRMQLNPQHQSFTGEYANQTFLYLLAFYVGTVVAKHAKREIHWYPYEEMIKVVQKGAQLQQCFTTSMTCVLGGRAHFIPISPMEDRLFSPSPSMSVQASGLKFISIFESPRSPSVIRQNPGAQTQSANGISKEMHACVESLGNLSAWAVWMVSEGSGVMPIITSGDKKLRQLMFENLEDAVAAGKQELDKNPKNESQLAFVFDGSITLSLSQTDALVAECRQYTPKSLFKKSTELFRMTIAIPYRAKNDIAGFQIYTPKLISHNTNAQWLPEIYAAFYAGVDQFKQPQVVWPKNTNEFS